MNFERELLLRSLFPFVSFCLAVFFVTACERHPAAKDSACAEPEPPRTVINGKFAAFDGKVAVPVGENCVGSAFSVPRTPAPGKVVPVSPCNFSSEVLADNTNNFQTNVQQMPDARKNAMERIGTGPSVSNGGNPMAEDAEADEENDDGMSIQESVSTAWRNTPKESKIIALGALVDRFGNPNRSARWSTPDGLVPEALRACWLEDDDENPAGGDVTGTDGSWDDEESMSEADFSNLANIMTAALEDDDEEIRDEALLVMAELPKEACDFLSQLLMCGDDEYLKSQLLDGAKADLDDFSVMLFMQALDDADPAIHEKAAMILRELFSIDFSSSEVAYEWWERNYRQYVVGPYGVEHIPEPRLFKADDWEN